jgi:UDP-N-acetylmuramate--alanine ligase
VKKLLGKTERLHFVGIGGIGMSGLAVVLKNLKFEVSGSDINRTHITETLAKKGIHVVYRHKKENVTGADVVVYSTAIPENNPEISEAKRLGIPLIHRGELLAELTRLKISVCISGTHGKTTTTSIVGEVLQKGGLEPTTIVGGIVKGKSQAHLGRGDYLVCEADESDKSFLRLLPAYAVITNIEAEHLDHYGNLDEIKDSFSHFANHVPFWGCVFLCADSLSGLQIRNKIFRKVIFYGLGEFAHLRARTIERTEQGTTFSVSMHNKHIGKFMIRIPGRHNITNATAAIGVGMELGIRTSCIRDSLAEFKGVHRRIEYLGEVNSIKVFDDYGHHPTEIAVTLQTLREYYPKERIIAVFQPHRYTRTYHLFDQFAFAFLYANIVVVTDIYAAHELPIPGVTADALAKRLSKEQDAVHYIADFDRIVDFLKRTSAPNDIIVLLGAGNINELSGRLLKELA